MTEIAIFSVGRIECAIEMTDLLNVAPYAEPRRLPGAPPALLGIASFVEAPILVVDLAAVLSATPSTPDDRRCLAIVKPANAANPACGLVVGALQGVVDGVACPEEITAPDVPLKFVRRVLLHQGSPVPLLAVDRIEAVVRGVDR